MPLHRSLKVTISVVSVSLATAHVIWPELKIDIITLSLLAMAALPWLQPIFKSFKLPGGFEVTLQEMKHDIQAAAGAAQSAERKAELAVSNLVPSPESSDDGSHQSQDASSELERLARRYEKIRAEQSGGAARTQAMTRLVREMLELQPNLPTSTRIELLQSSRSGDRLAAYATFIASPEPPLLQTLTVSVCHTEQHPFGQYWGLQAIGRNLPTQGDAQVPLVVREALQELARRLPQGTDRYYEISKILRHLKAAD